MLTASPTAPAPERITTPEPAGSPVLLYDGECGLCAGSVQFVLRHERPARQRALRFAPLNGAFGTTLAGTHPELVGLDSVVWYQPGARETRQISCRSDAVLAVLSHLGGGWRLLAAVGRLVPRPLRDAMYRQVAHRRLTLAAPACHLPTPTERSRFLP
jgi:predicted DCC family thiol-disulfide oxidoreductase YuxK